MHINDPESHPMGKLLKNYDVKDFLGETMDSDLTLAIARGSIDPNSRKPYDLILRELERQQML